MRYIFANRNATTLVMLLAAFALLAVPAFAQEDTEGANEEQVLSFVDDYVTNYLANQPNLGLTPIFPTLTEDQAIDFQEAFVDEIVAQGDAVVGYKLGFTGYAPLPFDAPRPIYGRLLASQEIAAGNPISVSENFIAGGVGVELGIIISEDAAFAPEDFPLDDETLMNLIGGIVPTAEMADFSSLGAVNYLDLYANSAAAGIFVRGEEVTLDELEMGLDNIAVTATRDGEVIYEGMSGNLLEGQGQLAALSYMLERLAERGLGVSAGDIIATGTFGADLPLTPGDVEIDYGPLGVITLTFVE
ncbi:MAG: fumarylacetoacetate hydrolase family protein [Chloroflexota bacterium]